MGFLQSCTQTKIRQFDMAVGIKKKIIGFNIPKNSERMNCAKRKRMSYKIFLDQHFAAFQWFLPVYEPKIMNVVYC